MDSFTERMLERAKVRQAKLKEHYNNTNEVLKQNVQEPDILLKKYENASKSQPNLTECDKFNKKVIVSEPDLNIKTSAFKENVSDTNLNKKNCTRISSDLQRSPLTPTKTLNIQKENFNMEIKLTSAENVRVEVEIEEHDDEDSNSNELNDDDKPIIRSDVKNRLQRLGKLYSGIEDGQLSSPIHRTESKFYEDDVPEEETKKPNKLGLGKLKALANLRNQWEDDVAQHTSTTTTITKDTPKKNWKAQAPKSPVAAASPKKGPAPQPPTSSQKNVNGNSKSVSWDNTVLASLESQGFTRTNSNTKLVYNYKDQSKVNPKTEVDKDESKMNKMTAKFDGNKTSVQCGTVLNKVAQFEQSPEKINSKDPALLSVSERKALFEKNKGTAIMPKAAFAMAVPIKDKTDLVAKPIEKPTSPKKSSFPSPSKTSVISPTKAFIAESGGIASKMKALLEKKSTISQSQIETKIKQQREKDLDVLLNRFNTNKEVNDDSISEDEAEYIPETTKMIKEPSVQLLPPPPPPAEPEHIVSPKRRSKGDSAKVREVLEEVKRIRVSPPKSGRMYPCLSDIEASATELEPDSATTSQESSFEENCSTADTDEPNTSFGKEILEVVCKNQTPQKRTLNDSTASDLSDILDGMDDYLDEALAEDSSDYTNEGPTPPKHGRATPPRNSIAPSNSFHYSKVSPKVKSPEKQYIAISSPKKFTELPSYVVDGESVLPLTHTVSFYRKQQAQGSRTPVRQITRQPAVEEETSSEDNSTDESLEVSNKIQELMNTVSKQQTVISQASQALNLCCSTIEFSGSSEQVEAERLLLVATQRRQAALHEVQRLRVEGTLHPGGNTAVDKGSLTISDIILPLKKEYVRALSAAGGQGHHVVCLVRYAEHVIPTRLVSTVASPRDAPDLELRIPGVVRLDNIYSDFTVTVEVYSLQAQEELLPHELKYHIGTKKSGGGKLTPRKKQESKLVMPTIQSPAGPQAVRTTAFALMGYVVFSLQAINRTIWTLNNTPAMSPLEGNIQMRVTCEFTVSVEHRGFLTMFEDVSGFGAWHRRWCLLKGHTLSYWKYPDDERKKAPIDSINLQICTTKSVGPVSREVCARPHTFLLETVRPNRPGDKDSLVMARRGDQTIIRHLLSADTKEERIEWCEQFNKTLDTIRLWGNHF